MRKRGAVTAVLTAVCLVILLAPASVSTALPPGERGPRLMRVSPWHEDAMGRDAVVVLSFDRPMDPESLQGAISFDPPVDFAVSGESECLVVPLNLLAADTDYIFRLESGKASDRQGTVFGGEAETSFRTRADGMSLEIPALGYSGEVLEGEDPQGVADAIGLGVGHYPGAGRPGRGNLVIMAHASGVIYFPFNHILDLRYGDEIRLSYGGRDYVYAWSEGLVVRDTDTWIVEPTPHPMLTAFVCCGGDGKLSPTFHPPYRYVVRASLEGVE